MPNDKAGWDVPDWIYKRLPQGWQDKLYNRTINQDISRLDNGLPVNTERGWHQRATADAWRILDADNAVRNNRRETLHKDLVRAGLEPMEAARRYLKINPTEKIEAKQISAWEAERAVNRPRLRM